jgi:hypothetical protein
VTRGLEPISYRGVSTLLHATAYAFLHNLLNVLVQIANKVGLQKELTNIFFFYIMLHSLDKNVFKTAVGCGICHINTKIYTRYSPRKQSDYTYGYLKIHPHILSIYAIYTTFK